MNLLILESPGKVKKVQSILGGDWKVVASVGHVRDLPERELGIALPNFTPSYTPTERGKEVLGRLKGLAASASAVYLATDPDREGEAIAWHLADALRLKNPRRVTYGEITESAVKAAVQRIASAAILSAGLCPVRRGHVFLPVGCKVLRRGWWWNANRTSETS